MPEDKMITEQVDLRKYPNEPEVKTQEISRRRSSFLSIGFSESWIDSLQESRPTLYAPEIVRGHIDGLSQRGFSNPHKMIESSPAILGYAFENIDRRLKMFNRLISHYGLQFDAIELMEGNYFLFSSKIDKLWTLTRILAEFQLRPDDVTSKLIRNIVSSNLEDVLVALKNKPHGEEIVEFMRRVRTIKKQKIPKVEKRQIIKDELAGFDKVKRRYFRGYPQVDSRTGNGGTAGL